MNYNSFKKIYKYKTRILLLIILLVDVLLFFILTKYDLKIDSDIYNMIISIVSSSFGAIVIAIIYDFFLKSESDDYIISKTLKFVDEELPDAIITKLLCDKEIQKKYINENEVKNILNNCLAYKLSDDEMANELNNSLINKILNSKNKIYDLNVEIILEDIAQKNENFINEEQGQKNNDNNEQDLSKSRNVNEPLAYQVFNKLEEVSYTCKLEKNTFTFFATNDNSLHSEYLGIYDYCLYSGSLKFGDIVSFEVIKFKIEEVEVKEPIIEKTDSSIKYTFNLDDKYKNKLVNLYYFIKSIARKNGNYYYHKIPFPTKKFTLKFDMKDTNVKKVNSIPFFISEKKCAVTEVNDKRIIVSLNDWVFPESGTIFVWRLYD